MTKQSEKFVTLSEAARIVGVSAITLRRWLLEKKVAEVGRDRNGWRVFSSGRHPTNQGSCFQGHPPGDGALIRDDQIPELKAFKKIERRFSFRDDAALGTHVVAGLNEDKPVHRWFRFKESFSSELLGLCLSELYPRMPKSLAILDPFAGVGTTLLAAQALAQGGTQCEAIGIERNPFIAFTARTKLAWASVDPTALMELGEVALDMSKSLTMPLPHLSGIKTGRCISRHVASRLVALRECIGTIAVGSTRDALLLGLAASIEPLSKTRKDGRALRLVSRPPRQVSEVVRGRWAQIAADCSELHAINKQRAQPLVLEGDGRDPGKSGIEAESIDLVFTSPPYPNNIDYTEVYKLELWLMGFVRTAEEFLAMRKRTFRSHPTCAEPDVSEPFRAQLQIEPLKSLLGSLLVRSEPEKWRHRLFTGYFSDLWSTLSNAYYCLRQNGHAVFVVGNSLHGGTEQAYLVPTDLAIATMAKLIGFEVVETVITRNLKRRLAGNHFLRESIIVLKKNA